MMYWNRIKIILAFAFLNVISTVDAQSLYTRMSTKMDSARAENTRIWLKAQEEALKKEQGNSNSLDPNYDQAMAELEKSSKDVRLKKINDEIEAYKRLVAAEIKEATPIFGLDGQSKATGEPCNDESNMTYKAEGTKWNDNLSEAYVPKDFVYDQTTFASQREMLDFIKTLDFDKNPPAKRLQDFYNVKRKLQMTTYYEKELTYTKKGKRIKPPIIL